MLLNTIRFVSFILFSLGVSLMAAYGLRRFYHRLNLRSLLNRFDQVFDEAFRIMLTFRKHLFSDDRDNARTFLISELRRSPITLPRRFRGFYDLLVKSAFSSIEKRQDELEEGSDLLGETVKDEIRRVMVRSYENRCNQQSLSWISTAVPCVVAPSIFFPLLIYTHYPLLLRWHFWIFALVGLVLLVQAIRYILRDWSR